MLIYNVETKKRIFPRSTEHLQESIKATEHLRECQLFQAVTYTLRFLLKNKYDRKVRISLEIDVVIFKCRN